MSLDGESTSDSKEIANLFAKNFSSVYSKDVVVPPEFSCERFVCLDFITINEVDVLFKLNKLNGREGSGPDGLHPLILKKCCSAISRPLTLLFNESLSSGIFPNKWKVAHISPIHKSGKKSDIKNYRPVSIISVIPKIFECLVYNTINAHLSHLINSNQHGFLKNRSTSTNLVSFTHFVSSIIELRGQVDVVYTDFSKAFDVLNHNLLISKLNSMGISNRLLDWMASFHSSRIQLVKIGNYESDPIYVTSGCIQGGHMSGLLFLLFINDISTIFSGVEFWMFADDLKVAMRVRGPRDAEVIQNVLSCLYHWCLDNGMVLNIDKCSVMSFYKTKSPFIANYHINGQALTRREHIRDLGVIFEKDLTFVTTH